MSDLLHTDLRDIENEQIRIFRKFMDDRDPRHIATLVALKRKWDEAIGAEPFMPAPDTAINNVSLSRKEGAIRRHKTHPRKL